MSNKHAILFDLDGTLLDTARDFAFAINVMRKKRNQPTIPFDVFRQHVHGESSAMVSFAFEMHDTHPEFTALKHEFLITYHQNSTENTCYFPGMAQLLAQLDQQQIPWGIVTNKPGWLMEPITTHFELNQRAQCIVTGDTLSRKKPDPAPLLHACQLAGFEPKNTWYVGDSETDIIAARAAGMRSVAVTYGYHKPTSDPTTWQANFIAQTPLDIVALLHQTLCH